MNAATWLPYWMIEAGLLGSCAFIGYGALLDAAVMMVWRKR